jgi:mRNA interferase RelE/StbE
VLGAVVPYVSKHAVAVAEMLPESVARAVWQFVSGPLLESPHRVGKRLRFELDGFYFARRGQYRVFYRIDDLEVIVDVIGISHRGDAYSWRATS